MERDIDRLVSKSIESFILGIEIYNKPTIKYRVEGFSFFICNAWELMLKALLLERKQTIYYKDSDRTLSLGACISKIFTNKNDPVRLNLEKIIELRNTSTHFIVEEFEGIYIPLFQACVLNFSNKMYSMHGVSTDRYVAQNFLTLRLTQKEIINDDMIAKYPKDIAQKLLDKNTSVYNLSQEIDNANFAIVIKHEFYITKNEKHATAKIKIDPNSDSSIQVVKEIKNPNETHKFKAKACIEHIKARIKKETIPFRYDFNMNHFQLFIKYYNLKSDEKYCFTYKILPTHTYSYSYHTIDFVVDKIKENPENIVDELKKMSPK